MNMAKAKKATLPKGFKEIGGMAEAWKPVKAGDSVMGRFTGTDVVTVEQREGKKKVKVAKNLHKFVTDDGEVYKVWQSGGLKALESVRKNQIVYIEFLGMGKAKPGQSAPRLYRVAAK
jgi:hypothetical protein